MSFSLFFDEHVDLIVAIRLSRDGHDVLTTQGAGRANQKLSDDSQLEFAAETGRALVTYNAVDFLRIFVDWADRGRHHSGLIIATYRTTPNELYEGLLKYFVLYPDGIPDLCLMI